MGFAFLPWASIQPMPNQTQVSFPVPNQLVLQRDLLFPGEMTSLQCTPSAACLRPLVSPCVL